MTVAEVLPARAAMARAKQPYPGLRPFTPEEWSIFCGRELIVEEVIDRLGARNVVLIHGGSGSGKSSLVGAGVLPTLAREYELAGARLASAIIRPSEGPFRALAAALAGQLGAPDDEPDAQRWWSRTLMLAPNIVELAERRIEAMGLEALCLIVDQFEEIFPWARDRRRSDVELLANFLGQVAAGEQGRRLFVLVTMRSDYLGSCAQFPALTALINDCQYFLPAMTDRGIARAIVEPAEVFGGSVRPELTERLLTGAATSPDPLPLLQHALMRMAERRRPADGSAWELTLDDLAEVDDDSNALSEHADELHAECLSSISGGTSEEADAALGWLFRALLEVDARGAAMRRPRDFAELVAVSGLPEANVEKVLATFSREGANLLVVRDNDEGAGRRRVDISHEALLRNWTRMAGATGWIRREFDDGLIWRTLATTARAGGVKLDAGLLAQVRPTWRAIAEAPERARRYLLEDCGKPAMEEEPEWIRVESLIRCSERTIRLKRWLWFAVFALVYCVFVGVALWWVSDDARSARENVRSARDGVAVAESAQARGLNRQTAIEIEGADTADSKAGAPETALTSEQVMLADTVAQGIDGVARTNAYIWVGDEDSTNLRRSDSEARVPVLQVREGESYRVTQNLALRSSTPASGNRSGPRIGAVTEGTIVHALGEPQPVEGQYWLRVAPDLPANTVYVQYSRGEPALAQAVERLRGLDFIVPEPEQLESALGIDEVRYCHESDRRTAERLASRLEVELRYIGASGSCRRVTRAGTIELWVDSLDRVAGGTEGR